MDLDKAIRLLRLPREVGPHPDDGGMILAGIGRYGPYVQHNGTYANLESAEEVFGGLDRTQRHQMAELLGALCARGACVSCCGAGSPGGAEPSGGGGR